MKVADQNELPGFFKNWGLRFLFQAVALIIGALFGAFVVFNILFLYRVLPHGGIW